VAEIIDRTSFWNRVLRPLRISMPLQATAVVLVGILSFYVYQRADYSGVPESRPVQIPVREEPTVLPDNHAQKSVAAHVQKPSSHRAPPREQKAAVAQKAAPKNHPAPVQPVSNAAAAGDAGTRRTVPLPVQGVAAGTATGGGFRIPRQVPFRLVPREQELVNLGEPTADYELLVRVRGRRPQESEPIGNAPEKAGPERASSGAPDGRLIALEPSSVLNILWFTVPQDRYEQFKNDLATQARIESEVPIGIRDRSFSFRSDGPLFIKVVVLAPTE